MLTIICNNTGNGSSRKTEDFTALIIGRCSYNFLLYYNGKAIQLQWSPARYWEKGAGGGRVCALTICRERSQNGATESGIIRFLINYLAFSNSCFSLNVVVSTKRARPTIHSSCLFILFAPGIVYHLA